MEKTDNGSVVRWRVCITNLGKAGQEALCEAVNESPGFGAISYDNQRGWLVFEHELHTSLSTLEAVAKDLIVSSAEAVIETNSSFELPHPCEMVDASPRHIVHNTNTHLRRYKIGEDSLGALVETISTVRNVPVH